MRISRISKYMFAAIAVPFALVACSTDEEIASQESSSTDNGKGLYLKVNVAGSDIATRATVSANDNLYEQRIANLYMIIGNTLGTNAGKFEILDFTSKDISPEGRLQILSDANWKEGYKEIMNNSTESPYHVAVIANPVGLKLNDDKTALVSSSDNSVNITVSKNDDGNYVVTQEGLNKMLQAIEKDEDIYKPYTGDATTGKTREQTHFLMYGHTLWYPSTIQADDDAAVISVDVDRAAAKLYGTFTLSPTLLADWEMVDDPTCTLNTYATDVKISTSGIGSSGNDDVTFTHTPTVVEKEVDIPIKLTEGTDGRYVVNTYTYPFSWTSEDKNPYFCVKCKMKSKNTGVTKPERSYEFHVPVIPYTDNSKKSFERNNIYMVDVIWNFIETNNNTEVVYNNDALTQTYTIVPWTEENDVMISTVGTDKVWTITKTISTAKETATIVDNLSLTEDGWELLDDNKSTNGFESSGKTKKDKFTNSNLKNNVTVTVTQKKVTIKKDNNMDDGESFTFYVKNTKSDNTVEYYKFIITFKSSTEQTIPTIESNAINEISGASGYYYVDMSKTTASYIIAQPTVGTDNTSTDNYVSPAFLVAPASENVKSLSDVSSLIGSSISKRINSTSYSNWRLPTLSEIITLNKLNSSLIDKDKVYLALDGKCYKGDGTSSSETSGYIVPIHDLSASELSALKQ